MQKRLDLLKKHLASNLGFVSDTGHRTAFFKNYEISAVYDIGWDNWYVNIHPHPIDSLNPHPITFIMANGINYQIFGIVDKDIAGKLYLLGVSVGDIELKLGYTFTAHEKLELKKNG